MSMSMSFVPGSALGDDLEARRDDLLDHPDPSYNGIDFVDVDPDDHTRLRVTFLRPVPADPDDATRDAYGLADDPAERIVITGGTRVVDITAVSATRAADDRIDVVVDRAGDLGTYVLSLAADQLDPVLCTLELSFAAACPTDVDCETEESCPPATYDEPLIDYLARDYASFRRLLVDLATIRNPRWVEDNPADLAVAVLEALAYEGDRLAYFQDAVATEAYLATARTRRSVRRHARLVDYAMHDGRNAWTTVHFTVTADGTVPAGTPVTTKVSQPLSPGASALPGVLLAPDELGPLAMATDPPTLELPAALRSVAVFETTHDAACSTLNNEIQVHTWGRGSAALPAGCTEAYLFSVDATGVASRPVLVDGDLLLLEEVRGTTSPGRAADANRSHRQVVRLEGSPEEAVDALYAGTLEAGDDGTFDLVRTASVTDGLPLLRVRWRDTDALAFTLCVSTTDEDGSPIRSVGVARGNLALADHGMSVTEGLTPLVEGRTPVELLPSLGPLTQQAADRVDLAAGAGECVPAVTVVVESPTGRTDTYAPVLDLLDSGPFDRHLVAEVDDDGEAVLRFGDGEYGADPAGALGYTATYRVGNGLGGNVGADALVHVALDATAAGVPAVVAVRNPLAATGGVAQETIDEVRVAAPEAFRADQRRAVTEADYAAAALRLDSVQGAVARFRWTGSWWTVQVGIDPADPDQLVNGSDGRTTLSPELEEAVLEHLSVFRQAGYDLDLQAPSFVPVELDLDICVAAGHFRSDVLAAVRSALGASVLADGSPGWFHPANWTFGTALRLSSVYAAVESVEGVDSLTVTTLRRLGQPDNGELDRAILTTGAWEIVRCDNDPSFPEHGVLRLTAHGGKG